MISAIGFKSANINKGQCYHEDKKKIKEIENGHDQLISSDPIKKTYTFTEKFVNAFTTYPLKGLAGSKNSNFYEFLTMGMVPYTVGSLMLMSVFNGCTKYFKPFAQQKAANIGHKMAMGVLMYGLFKTVSKKFIEVPVHAATGINVNTSYIAVKAQLPENKNDPDNKKVHEYHKVFESVDFPRWDLMYGSVEDGNVNQYYDKVARRLGYGKNLLDSDQQVKNDIKETVIRTRVATTLSSYLWGALGVGLAVQDDWMKILASHGTKSLSECRSKEKFLSKAYFKEILPRLNTLCEILKARFMTKDGLKTVGLAVKNSFETLYKGGENPTKLSSAAGKALVWAAVGSTVLGAVNSMFNFHKKETICKEADIDYTRDYTVD